MVYEVWSSGVLEEIPTSPKSGAVSWREDPKPRKKMKREV